MAGVTIDQLDLSVYNNYALRTLMNEQINQQLRLGEAASIPPQIQVVDIYPRLSEMELLLGVATVYAPWALFMPPNQLAARFRRSPFSFHRVVPSFGSTERHDKELELLEEEESESEEEEEKQERRVLIKCIKRIKKINDWMGFVVGRIGQFLQG